MGRSLLVIKIELSRAPRPPFVPPPRAYSSHECRFISHRALLPCFQLRRSALRFFNPTRNSTAPLGSSPAILSAHSSYCLPCAPTCWSLTCCCAARRASRPSQPCRTHAAYRGDICWDTTPIPKNNCPPAQIRVLRFNWRRTRARARVLAHFLFLLSPFFFKGCIHIDATLIMRRCLAQLPHLHTNLHLGYTRCMFFSTRTAELHSRCPSAALSRPDIEKSDLVCSLHFVSPPMQRSIPARNAN
jgi:hypothetical protein